MERPIHLLALLDLNQEWRARLQAIDSRLVVTSNLAGLRAALAREQGRPLTEEETAAARALDRELERAEIIVTSYVLPPGLPAAAPNLRWLHTLAAGVDRMIGTPLMASDVIITNSKGGNAVPVAEYVLWLLLQLAKRGLQLAENQRQHLWDPLVVPDELFERTVAILGLGSIGQEVARRCRAFGMRVIGTRRSALAPASEPPFVDMVYPPSQLLTLLGAADYVVLALPLTDETRGLIGARELAAMKKGGFLVNVARGPIVDEDALVEALRSGHLGGAGLDVFVTEPLPPESPLWTAPNCVIAPHRAGVSSRPNHRAFEIFTENLERYCDGRVLFNLVNKELGY